MTRSLLWQTRTVLKVGSGYICPTCRHSSLKFHSDTSLRRRKPKCNGDADFKAGSYGTQRRAYKTSQVLTAAHVQERANPHVIDHDASIYPKSRSKQSSEESASKSKIRSSLRAWAAQNEQLGIASAPQTIEAEGRIRQLPNALFRTTSRQENDSDADDYATADGTFEENPNNTTWVLQPGTLIWHGDGDHGQYAVYIGNVGIQSVLAVESGNWHVGPVQSLRAESFAFRRLRIPNFLQAEVLEQIKRHVPKSNIGRPIGDGKAISEISMKGKMPQELTQVFMAAMHSFRQDVNTYLRQFAETFEEGYLRVASQDEYRSMTMTEFLAEGYDLEWEALKPPERMAITQHLAELDYVTTFQTSTDLSVIIMSKAMRKEAEQVVGWAREYQDAASNAALGRDVNLLLSQNPLTAFIDKARRLILINRKTRQVTLSGGLGPSSPADGDLEKKPSKVHTGVEFNSTDLQFINFIWTVGFRVPTPVLNGPLKLMPVTALILRAVGAYPDLVLRKPVARLFLKEIGCANPWAPHFYDMAFPTLNGKASQKLDALYLESDTHAKGLEDLIARRRFSDLDSMAHLRRKWDLPAFAIDPVETATAEDAISIEPSTELEGGHWVHVHVPHVSAFFEPDSIIFRLAGNLGFSANAIDESFKSNMLPEVLRRYFSLKQGVPVLTVSTLVDTDGSSVEVRMTVGILENLVRLSRKAVHDMLGYEEGSLSKCSVLLVGNVSEPTEADSGAEEVALVSKYKTELETIYKVLRRRGESRVQELPGEVSLPLLTFESNVSTSHREALDNYRERQSYHWRGDPGICLTARHHVQPQTELQRKMDLISQATRLAAESTGHWLEVRQVPAVYIGTEPVADNSFEQIANKKPYESFTPPLFVRASTPIPYWNVHLKQFCSFTSPLRRYIDLVAQCQISSYLKAEAVGTVQAGEPLPDENLLAFTKGQIEDYLRYDAHASDTTEHGLRVVKNAYTMQALFRAFHFGEAPLPTEWEVIISSPVKLGVDLTEFNAIGALIPFNVQCEILPDAAGWSKMARFGQYLPVKINAVNPEASLVQCTATGMPTDEQTMLKRFYAVSEKTSGIAFR